MRKLVFALTSTLLAGLALVAPVAAPAALAASGTKVAIIVGATHSATADYRTDADQLYAEAIKYTSNVVKVYSPNATWSKVKAAVNGASIVIYLGHGNGWPSPYTYDPNYTTKDGFGLNYDVNGDGKLSDYELKYYGEPSIATLTPAPNAVVLLFHLCYASGNSEPGLTAPTLTQAKQRVDNYASAFLKAGARAVIANGHSHDPYYVRALFTTNQTIQQYWQHAPDFHNHVLSYGSSRSPGYSFLMDPDSSTPSGFYRSLTGKLSLTTKDVTGADYASTSGDAKTMAVPGNASPVADGTPVFGSAQDAATADATPSGTLAATDKVRVDAKATVVAPDGSPVYAVHTDGGVTGWMRGSSLVPRDSLAPRLWTTDDGSGAFSPNGDGSKDTFPVTLGLSESAAWTLTVRDGGGDALATATGTGSAPTITWSPASESVPDGTYTWSLSATDAWGNGPLTATGPIVVDTEAPTITVADADAATLPSFAPNGDGYRDTIGFAVGTDEPGTITGTVKNAGGTTVDTVSLTPAGDTGTLTWDGRTGTSYAADGTYTISVVARDLAGNASAAQARDFNLYGSLAFVASSKAVFYPQDGDGVSSSTGLTFTLKHAATVTWRVVDAAGAPVRTIKSSAPLAAGSYSFVWNGRNDAGAYVARGTYRSLVYATSGGLSASQAATVELNAFRVTSSDTTPARGQRITVTGLSAEALKSAPKVVVSQPGLTAWTVSMSKSGSSYVATVQLKSSSRTGTLRLKVYGYDAAGHYQFTYLELPIH